jgi:murein DD-endopeptidase MepM/ murein hydrolase activator NlpD
MPVGRHVYAPVTGKVIGTGTTWGAAFGRHQIVIQFEHKNKYALRARTYWVILAHCSATLVQPGEWVRAGQLIGKSGAEGNVSGPHLHLEVQTSSRWGRTTDVNPQFVLDLPKHPMHRYDLKDTAPKKIPGTRSSTSGSGASSTWTEHVTGPATKKPGSVKKTPAKPPAAKKTPAKKTPAKAKSPSKQREK